MKKLSLTLLLCSASVSTWALESLDDTQLANATGQDGITIAITRPNATMALDRIIYHDRDGFTSRAVPASTGLTDNITAAQTTGAGALSINMLSGFGISLCKNTSLITALGGGCGTGNASVNPSTLTVDFDGALGGAGKPAAVLQYSTPSDARLIKIDLASISLRPELVTGLTATSRGTLLRSTKDVPFVQFQNSTTAAAGAQILLDTTTPVGQSAFKLTFVLGSSGTINGSAGILTGSPAVLTSANAARNDALINFTKAKFDKIDLGTIALVNGDRTGGNGYTTSGTVVNETESLRLDLSISNLDLSGAAIDISSNGLVFSTPYIPAFDVRIGNVIVGTPNAVSAGTFTFDSTGVGALGSFGATGLVVTNTQTAISGL